MLAMLLATLDQTIVANALPTIALDLHGIQHYAWVADAYLVTSTVTVPLYGKLSDMFGRRSLFLVSISIFLVGSALCGLSQSMTQLIVFRALQGFGAGGILPLAQATIGDLFSARQRGRYAGYTGAVFASAPIIGPLVGGYLTASVYRRVGADRRRRAHAAYAGLGRHEHPGGPARVADRTLQAISDHRIGHRHGRLLHADQARGAQHVDHSDPRHGGGRARDGDGVPG